MKSTTCTSLSGVYPSHPARGAWIEIYALKRVVQFGVSHPARGAWIEIIALMLPPPYARVAPRKGCVD